MHQVKPQSLVMASKGKERRSKGRSRERNDKAEKLEGQIVILEEKIIDLKNELVNVKNVLVDCRLALQRTNTVIDELKTAAVELKTAVSIIPEHDCVVADKQNEDVVVAAQIKHENVDSAVESIEKELEDVGVAVLKQPEEDAASVSQRESEMSEDEMTNTDDDVSEYDGDFFDKKVLQELQKEVDDELAEKEKITRRQKRKKQPIEYKLQFTPAEYVKRLMKSKWSTDYLIAHKITNEGPKRGKGKKIPMVKKEKTSC